MASTLEKFVDSPSDEIFDSLSKEQLLQLAETYKIDVSAADKRLKETIKSSLRASLVEKGIMSELKEATVTATVAAATSSSLTFEQQRELLRLQLETKKLETDLEMAKLEIEAKRLQLVDEGKLKSDSPGLSPAAPKFHIASNLKLVPPFNERDLDSFFSLFERVADAQAWPSTERTLMLQCVFKGKAQRVYSSMSLEDSRDYQKVKAAVLKAYSLVPEAYRQRFRNLRRRSEQTYVEFAQDLKLQCQRWCSASEAQDYEELFNLLLLEQFTNTLPVQLATYIMEHELSNVSDAAVLADDYEFTHRARMFNCDKLDWQRNSAGDPVPFPHNVYPPPVRGEGQSARGQSSPGRSGSDKVCHYCRGSGHWKPDCPLLKQKVKTNASPEKSSRTGYFLSVCSQSDDPSIIQSRYLPFISDGSVSLPGSADTVPVKILRDTGSSESFILNSVLPFNARSDTGDNVLICGFGPSTFSVPLHRVNLQSQLVQGVITLGVCSALPVDGVSVLIGNNLAGHHVWGDSGPPLQPTDLPSLSGECAGLASTFPDVFPACVVSSAAHRATKEQDADGDVSGTPESRLLREKPPSLVTHAELTKGSEQDPSLKPLLGQVNSTRAIGPYKLMESDESNLMTSPNRHKSSRPAHVSRLKVYYERGKVLQPALRTGTSSADFQGGERRKKRQGSNDSVLSTRLINSESLNNLAHIFGHLPEERLMELVALLQGLRSPLKP